MRAARSDSPSRSSSDTSTPICESSRTMVLTSRRCGTLESVSSSSVSSAAHIRGSAAFFAPDTRISPDSLAPPWIRSLSIHLLGGERAHRQRVDLRSHAFAQRRVHELVALDPALSAKCLAHDESLEVLPVPGDPDFLAREGFFDIATNLLRSYHA